MTGTDNPVMAPVHPGTRLMEDFLEPLGIGSCKPSRTSSLSLPQTDWPPPPEELRPQPFAVASGDVGGFVHSLQPMMMAPDRSPSRARRNPPPIHKTRSTHLTLGNLL
jgi:hypothetical protein